VIDLPSTDPTLDLSDGNPPESLIPTSSIPTPTSLPTATPKHTFIQDEEESFDLPNQVWTLPDNEIEVPVPPRINPTDVAPVPAVIGDVPCHSACVHVPSSKTAEAQGIRHVPHVTQAVAESCEVGRRLKEQRAQAKFEHRQQVLDLQASLTNVTPSPPSTPIIPADAIPDDSLPDGPLPPPPALNLDTDFITFCEAYVAELASPLINTHNPDEPTFRKAMNSPDADKWILGIQDELKSLKEMGVYRLVPRSDVPTGQKILRGKWVLLLKRDKHGNAVCHKAWFVVKGFEQVFGQDYVDTTSPTACMESVRLLLNIATAKDWDI